MRQAEPNLRAGLAGGLRVIDDGVIYPPCGARFLLDEAIRHGAAARLGAPVRRLLPEGGVELADGTKIAAGRSINAAGPWSPELTPGLPVRKRKGHLVITERYPGFVHHQIVELGYLKSAHSVSQDSVAFNIQPRKTGQMLIGSSRQFDAETSEVDSAILEKMLQRAHEYLPTLGKLLAPPASGQVTVPPLPINCPPSVPASSTSASGWPRGMKVWASPHRLAPGDWWRICFWEENRRFQRNLMPQRGLLRGGHAHE